MLHSFLRTTIVRNTVAVALLATAGFATSSYAFLIEDDKAEIQRAVTEVDAQRREIRSFLKKYGIEIVREKNMTQKGEIRGSLKGKVGGGGGLFNIGNLGKLASTFAATGPFTIGSLLLNTASGLSGFGGGAFSLKGSVHGEMYGTFEGSGEKINDKAHLFLVMYKDDKGVLGQQSIARIKQYLDAGEYSEGPAGRAESLVTFAESSLLPSELQVKSFRQDLSEISDKIESLKAIYANNIMMDDVYVERLGAFTKGVESWLSDKRVQFAKPVGIRDAADKYSIQINPFMKKNEDMYLSYRYFYTNGYFYDKDEPFSQAVDKMNTIKSTFMDIGPLSLKNAVKKMCAKHGLEHGNHSGASDITATCSVLDKSHTSFLRREFVYAGIEGLSKFAAFKKSLVSRADVDLKKFKFEGTELRLYF